MNNTLYAFMIALLIMIYTLQSFLSRKYSESYPGPEQMSSAVFTVVSGLVVTVVSFVVSGFVFTPSVWTIILGVCNAVALFMYNTCIIKASTTGPYSILMVFMIAGGIVIPTLVSIIGFGDTISIWKALSVAVILFSVYLVSQKNEANNFTDKKTFLLSCIGLGVFNGVYGSLLAVQQEVTGAADKEEMIAVTYFCAFLFALIPLLKKNPKEGFAAFRQTKRSFIYLIASAIVVALAINLLTLLVAQGKSLTVLYTFDNAGVFLISVIFSCIFFNEKLSVKNLIGCITMCIALVCVTLF